MRLNVIITVTKKKPPIETQTLLGHETTKMTLWRHQKTRECPAPAQKNDIYFCNRIVKPRVCHTKSTLHDSSVATRKTSFSLQHTKNVLSPTQTIIFLHDFDIWSDGETEVLRVYTYIYIIHILFDLFMAGAAKYFRVPLGTTGQYRDLQGDRHWGVRGQGSWKWVRVGPYTFYSFQVELIGYR